MTREPRDYDEIADEILPVDGPHSPEAVTTAAALIGELVRRLNHATMPERVDRSLRYPSNVDRVAGALHRALCLLPQTCGQLAYRLDALAKTPGLYDDRRDRAISPPSAVAAMAASGLRAVGVTAALTASELAEVCRHTTHLGVDTAERPEADRG